MGYQHKLPYYGCYPQVDAVQEEVDYIPRDRSRRRQLLKASSRALFAVYAISVKDVVNDTDDAEVHAEMAKHKGYLIGYTDTDGEVKHRFRADRYILVAIKDGFVPGFHKIVVKPLLTASAEPMIVPE